MLPGPCDKAEHFCYLFQMDRFCNTKVVVFSKVIKALADSGASDSYVSNDFYKNHLLKHGCSTEYATNSIVLNLAGNRSMFIRNPKIVSFTFSSLKGDICAEARAIVLPRCDPPFILGRPCMAVNNAKITLLPEVQLPLPPLSVESAESCRVTRSPRLLTVHVKSMVPFTGRVTIYSTIPNVKIVQSSDTLTVNPNKTVFKIRVYTDSVNDILIEPYAKIFIARYEDIPTPMLAMAVHEGEDGIKYPCRRVCHSNALVPTSQYPYVMCCKMVEATQGTEVTESDSTVVPYTGGDENVCENDTAEADKLVVHDNTTNMHEVVAGESVNSETVTNDESIQVDNDTKSKDSVVDKALFCSFFPPFTGIPQEESDRLHDLLYEKRQAFFHPSLNKELLPAKVEPVKLVIKPGSPVVNRSYYCHFNNEQKKIAHEQLVTWIGQGVAGYYPPNELCFISPLVLVPSKKKKSYRLCINLKRLNDMVVAVQSQVPGIHQLIHALGSHDNDYYCTVDLASSYLQIQLHPDSYKWLCVRDPLTNRIVNMKALPFGLVNSGYFLCQAVNMAFGDMFISMHLTAFVDDIAYASRQDNFFSNTTMVLDKLIEFGFKANPEKSNFGCKTIAYLGFTISPTGYTPCASRVEVLSKIPYPVSQRELKSFLGMVQYFSVFIPSFKHAWPVFQELLTQEARMNFRFLQKHEQAFDMVIQDLKQTTQLAFVDETADFYIITDSSAKSAAGVLFQYLPVPGTNQLGPRPIAFCARALTQAERNYPITHLELLNCVYCVSKFEAYFGFSRVHVITDCKPILDMYKKVETTSGRLCRNLTYLMSKSIILHYVEGQYNAIDYLSRVECLPVEEAETLSHKEMFQGDSYDPDPEYTLFTVERKPLPPVDSEPFSLETLQTEQAKDPYVSVFVKYLQDGELPEQPRALLKEVTLTACQHALVDGILYRVVDCGPHLRMLIVLPKALVTDVLFHFHSQNHPGQKALIKILRQRFHWQSLTNDVVQYTRACERCGRYKISPVYRVRHTGTHGVVPPGEALHADVCGPFQTSFPHKYAWVLIIVDQGSRHVGV